MSVRPVLGLVAVAALLGACTSTRAPTATTTTTFNATQAIHASQDNTGTDATTSTWTTGDPNPVSVVIGSTMRFVNVPATTGAAGTAWPSNFAPAATTGVSQALPNGSGGGNGNGSAAFFSSAVPTGDPRAGSTDSGVFIRNDLGAFAAIGTRGDLRTAGTVPLPLRQDVNMASIVGGGAAITNAPQGNATWTGLAAGYVFDQAAGLTGVAARGDATVNANLGTGQVDGTLGNFRTVANGTNVAAFGVAFNSNGNGAIVNNRFNLADGVGGATVSMTDGAGNIRTNQDADNRAHGQFSGVNGQTVVGNVYAGSGTLNNALPVADQRRTFTGSFVAGR